MPIIKKYRSENNIDRKIPLKKYPSKNVDRKILIENYRSENIDQKIIPIEKY